VPTIKHCNSKLGEKLDTWYHYGRWPNWATYGMDPHHFQSLHHVAHEPSPAGPAAPPLRHFHPASRQIHSWPNLRSSPLPIELRHNVAFPSCVMSQ
jgi:hypothetical protein